MAKDPGDFQENRLLASLPQPDFERVLRESIEEPLDVRRVLYDVDTRITDVFFPRSGVVSWVTPVESGEAVETATVGLEGFVGVPALLGGDRVHGRGVVQLPGRGLRVAVDRFRGLVETIASFRAALQRYTQAVLVQMAQSSACSRLHPIEARCARRLLATHDRVEGDTFLLTQEFLSQMLGVRRATVSSAQGVLQRAGTIRYSRGRVTVLDRDRLEQAACGCYHTVRREYERLVGSAAG